ncbi:hypothetical protein H4R35_000086 [Dimargaris xerosporica]|nr:hypothetical protein H4R35_000086 [Dimargaris xerosporica]
MYLEWIKKLRLLNLPEESDLLTTFPVNTRKALVKEVVNVVTDAEAGPNLLPTNAHVWWVMVILGQAFELPLEDLSIADSVINVYQQWLLEPKTRPLAFRSANHPDEEQRLFQKIFLHMSMIFEQPASTTHFDSPPVSPTSATSPTASGPSSSHTSRRHHHYHQAQTRHTNITLVPGKIRESTAHNDYLELCKHVLQVVTMAGRTTSSTWSKETWTVLMRVLLGITDYLLSRHHPGKGESSRSYRGTLAPGEKLRFIYQQIDYTRLARVGEDLSEHLIRVLTEMWLRSQMVDNETWDMLDECFQRWNHHIDVVHQWSAVIYGLTNRMLRIMYHGNPSVGSERVNMAFKGLHIKLELPDEYVRFAWKRVVKQGVTPFQLNPKCHLALMTGMAKTVDLILGIGWLPLNGNKTGPCMAPAYPPSVNDLLETFGVCFFTGACVGLGQTHVNGFAVHQFWEGRAKAYSVLCRIFATANPRYPKPHQDHLVRFYSLLRQGLANDECLQAILLDGHCLLTADLDGIRMLIPDIIAAIKRVLPTLEPNFRLMPSVPVNKLRYAALRTMANLQSTPALLALVPIGYPDETFLQDLLPREKPLNDRIARNQQTRDSGSTESEVSRSTYGGTGSHRAPGTLPTAEPRPTSKEGLLELTVTWIRKLYGEQTHAYGRTFGALKVPVIELLLTSIIYETDSANIAYLFQLVVVFVLQDVAITPGIVGLAADFLRLAVLTVNTSPGVVLKALDTLVRLSELLPQACPCDSVMSSLVHTCCDIMERLIAASPPTFTDVELIIKTLECIQSWTTTGTWAVRDRPLLDRLSILLQRAQNWSPDHINANGDVSPQVPSGGPMDSFTEIRSADSSTSSQMATFFTSYSFAKASMPFATQRKQPSPVLTPSRYVRVMALDTISRLVSHITSINVLARPGRKRVQWSDTDIIKDRILTPSLNMSSDYFDEPRPAEANTSYLPRAYFYHVDDTILGLLEFPIIEDERIPNDNGSNNCVQGPALIITCRTTSEKVSWRQVSVSNMPFDEDPEAIQTPSNARQSNGAAASPTPATPSPTELPCAASTDSGELFQSKVPLNTENGSNVASIAATMPELTPPLRLDIELLESDVPLMRTIKQWLDTTPTGSITRGFKFTANAEQPFTTLHAPSLARILLAQFGYVSNYLKPYAIPLTLSQSLLRDLQRLDSLTDQTKISASVLYVASEDTHWSDIVSPWTPVSDKFVRFWQSLGSCTNLANYQGYKGPLTALAIDHAIVFQDTQQEHIYYIPQLAQFCQPLHRTKLSGTFASNPAAEQVPKSSVDDYVLFDKAVMRDFVSIIWVDQPLVLPERDMVTRIVNQHHMCRRDLKKNPQVTQVRIDNYGGEPHGDRNASVTDTHLASDQPSVRFTDADGSLEGTMESEGLASENSTAQLFHSTWLPILFYLVITPIPQTKDQMVKVTAVIVNPDQTNPKVYQWVNGLERQFEFLRHGVVISHSMLGRWLRWVLVDIEHACRLLRDGYRHS